MTGFATVNKMQSRGLNKLTKMAAIRTAIRTTGAELAITSGRKVFSAQFAVRFRNMAAATATKRKNSHPMKERPLGSRKFSR